MRSIKHEITTLISQHLQKRVHQNELLNNLLISETCGLLYILPSAEKWNEKE